MSQHIKYVHCNFKHNEMIDEDYVSGKSDGYEPNIQYKLKQTIALTMLRWRRRRRRRRKRKKI